MRPRMNLLRLNGVRIYKQLLVEEALLRGTKGNWCILNRGVDPPEVVMGIGARTAEVIHPDKTKTANIRLIRRFTGGGTVVVDKDTVFVTFVCNREDVPSQPQYPRDVMRWSERFYKPVFDSLLRNPEPGFSLQDHDYCIGEQKVGGNAQSMTRNRWVHHTSFLWDYNPARMDVLSLPKKQPAYREGRDHDSFLTTLSSHVQDTPNGVEDFFDAVEEQLREGFAVEEAVWEHALAIANTYDGRRSNKYEEL